jgi:hypothetical protein
MAERLAATIREPKDLVDVLSRPNIGVLRPISKSQGSPVYTSITVASLGCMSDTQSPREPNLNDGCQSLPAPVCVT